MAPYELDPMSLVPESGKCMGCGIQLQCEDAMAPGYFKVPERLVRPKSKIPPGVIAIEADSPLLKDDRTRQAASRAVGTLPAVADAPPCPMGPRRREAEAAGLIRREGPGDAVTSKFDSLVTKWLKVSAGVRWRSREQLGLGPHPLLFGPPR